MSLRNLGRNAWHFHRTSDKLLPTVEGEEEEEEAPGFRHGNTLREEEVPHAKPKGMPGRQAGMESLTVCDEEPSIVFVWRENICISTAENSLNMDQANKDD